MAEDGEPLRDGVDEVSGWDEWVRSGSGCSKSQVHLLGVRNSHSDHVALFLSSSSHPTPPSRNFHRKLGIFLLQWQVRPHRIASHGGSHHHQSRRLKQE